MSWIGFDLDGTIAFDHGRAWGPPGPPIPAMIALIKAYRAQGHDVRIFTARISQVADLVPEIVADIEAWSLAHLGEVLPITCQKDTSLWRFYDDRCVQVEKNTGRVLEDILTQIRATLGVDASAEDRLRLIAKVCGPPLQ